MKSIRVFFALYIACLSVLPCNDGQSCASSARADNGTMGAYSEHHEEEHTDLCSPFCGCTCCHTHVVSAGLPLATTITENESSYNHDCRMRAIRLTSHTVWLPPKIG